MSALNSNDRYLCANKWQKFLKDECNLSFTQPFNIINTLGTPNEVRIWTTAGLSTDQFSTENAIIAQNSRRFPFIINPNQSFNNWIKRLYPNLVVIDFEKSNQDFKEILFKAIKTGEIVLVENVNDPELNPTLKSLIENEIVVKEGIQVCVEVIIIGCLLKI
jgi:dynein heavy chain